MTDEKPQEDTATATATEPIKLQQTVDIRDIGPCKKHIKVTVAREDIDGRFGEKIQRARCRCQRLRFPSRQAPRRSSERRFQKEVGDQVKTEILLASLEQLAEDHDVAPLAPRYRPATKSRCPTDGPSSTNSRWRYAPNSTCPTTRG